MLFACQTCLFTDSLSKKGIEISLIPHSFLSPVSDKGNDGYVFERSNVIR